MGACGSHSVAGKIAASCGRCCSVEYRDFTSCSSGDEMPCCCSCFPKNRPTKPAKNRQIAARIKQLDDSCHMEKKILKQNNNIPIGRSSSPTKAHRCGGDSKPSVFESAEDQIHYPRWKSHLEQTDIIPVEVPRLPEAISAGSTPNWFPTSTTSNPPPQSKSQPKPSTAATTSKSRPIVDHNTTQVFYYLTVLEGLDNDVEVDPEQGPTPYQLYMQHQQQTDRKFPHVVVWTTPSSRSAAATTSTSDQSPKTSPPPPPVPDRATKPKLVQPVVKTYRRARK